jgi:Fur family transcriptional regulator, zinc uptake regulator
MRRSAPTTSSAGCASRTADWRRRRPFTALHRIESLNAFVGCIDPSRPHSAQYLICRTCGTVTELEDSTVAEAIAGQAARQGFSIDRQTVEVHGLCGHCAKAARAEHAHAS